LARRFGTSTEEIIKMMEKTGKSAAEIQEGWRPEAIKALHSRLIVETLIEEQKLEVSNEEVEQELLKIASESDTTLEEVKKYYEQENAKDYLKEDIKETKLFEILLAENTIKSGEKENYLDLIGNNG
jgi:trigger factor